MKVKMILYFKDVVIRTAKLSTCISKQVASLLIKDNRILAMGYNGTTVGMKHCTEIFDSNFDREKHHLWSNQNELHAEQNMISFCAKNGIKTEGTTIFLTISPCIHCAKIIVASGIKEIYYIELYDKDTSGVDFLVDNGVICNKI